MSARAVITMSPEQYLAGLKQLEAATNKSASKMENSFKEYGTSINKAGIAMRYVSSEMGAGAVAFGRAFQVLAGGKIAVAVAAIAGAFTALKEIWDKLTVSESEYNAKLDHSIESEQKHLDSLRKQESGDKALLDRLQELAKRENKTNEEKDEAIRLSGILSGKYDYLGISVNDLTGDYEDLLTAIKKINEAQKNAKLESMADVLAKQSEQSDKLFEKQVKGGILSQAWDLVTPTGAKMKQSLLDSYSNMGTTEGKLALVRMLANQPGTEEDIQKWKEIESSLEKQIELEKKMFNLRRYGSETEEQYASNRKKTSDAAAEAQKEEEAAWKARVAELDEEARKQEELDKKHGEALQKELEKEQQIVAERKKGAELRRTNDIASLRGMALRATGQDERADIEDAIWAETQAQGVPLDAATKAEIAARVKARRALSAAMETSTSPELYAPRVNSLIARGGSSAPVKMPKVEELQSRQLDATNKTNQIANRILNQMDGWNTI